MADITVSSDVHALMQAVNNAAIKTLLSLNNVENTTLSDWTGSSSIVTLGTISAGDWQGTAIEDPYISSAETWNAKAGTANQTWTGTHDFGGADSLEIPNSTSPTVNDNGEIALDTSVADFSHGIIKYFGGEEMGVVAMPIAQFTTPSDGYVVAYNATNNEFELVAQSGGGGGLTDFTETLNTASPNNTVNAAQLEVTGGTTNVDFVATPKGAGAFIVGPEPDNTTAGGNKRGARAVDLGLNRSSAAQVASGDDAVALGYRPTASGARSLAWNSGSATNSDSIALGGTASGQRAVSLRGETASNLDAVAIGVRAVAAGNQSMALIQGITARSSEIGFPSQYWSSTSGRDLLNGVITSVIERTTNSTPTDLKIYSQSGSDLFNIQTNYILFFEARIRAVSSAGAISEFTRRGVIKNIAGTTSLEGSIVTVGSDTVGISGSSVSITADDANDALKITVTGEADFSVTGVASTDVITSVGHPFSNGDLVIFTSLTGGSGLSSNTGLWYGSRYYVRDVSGDTFKLATTSGGTAVDFTTDITDGKICRPVRWAAWVTHTEIKPGI